MSNMDMLTTVYSYGSPEMALLSAAYTQITKWLNVPMYETAGCSDAKVLDQPAAIEALRKALGGAPGLIFQADAVLV